MKLKSSKKLNPHINKLKPFKIPAGLSIVIDTREQAPLFIKELPRSDGKVIKGGYTGKITLECIGELNIFIETVKYGDYTIRGFEDKFAIERKQMSDFYSYIGKERVDKTIPKMKVFRDIIRAGGFVMLAIECSEAEIMSGNMYSTLSPEVARGAINSFRIRYGVHLYFNKERHMLQRCVLDSMIKFYNIMREV